MLISGGSGDIVALTMSIVLFLILSLTKADE